MLFTFNLLWFSFFMYSWKVFGSNAEEMSVIIYFLGLVIFSMVRTHYFVLLLTVEILMMFFYFFLSYFVLGSAPGQLFMFFFMVIMVMSACGGMAFLVIMARELSKEMEMFFLMA